MDTIGRSKNAVVQALGRGLGDPVPLGLRIIAQLEHKPVKRLGSVSEPIDLELAYRMADSQALLRLIEPHLHPYFHTKWRLEDAATWKVPMAADVQRAQANLRRTQLIRSGVLKVGYHTGTVRVHSDK
jgi:hypothetical protein